MWRVAVGCLLSLWVLSAQTAEYMEKTPFQLSRAFSPGVVTDGGKIVWIAGQTATRDKDEKDISGNFERRYAKCSARSMRSSSGRVAVSPT